MTRVVLAVLLLFCLSASADTLGDSLSQKPRVYTKEHPLVYEDAWDLWPYVFLDDKGQPAGYNVDMLRLIFNELDIPYEIRLKSTSLALDDLRSGQSDLMLGMMAPFHDDYTRYYGKNVVHLFTHSVVHPTDSRLVVRSLNDLSTQQVIVHDGSFSHHLIQSYGWGLNAQPFNDMNLAIQVVSAENNGQVLWNTMSLKWLVHKYHASNLTLSAVDMPSGEYRFMSNDSNLLVRLDAAYTRLKAAEKLQPLEMKWFYPEEAARHTTPRWLWYVAYAIGALAFLLVVATVVFHLRERRATRDGRMRINRLAAVLKTCQISIWTYDVERKKIYWHGDDAQSQGAMSPDVLARRYWPSEFEHLRATILRLINKECETASLRMHIADTSSDSDANRIFSVVLSVFKSDNGQPKVIIATERDITDEARRLSDAEELAMRYKSVFSTAMIDMIYCNSDGYVANMNERAQHTFGITLDEARRDHLNIRTFFPDSDLLSYCHATHALTPGGTPIPKGTVPQADSRFYEMQIMPVFDSDQKPLGIYATGRDVSEVVKTYRESHNGLRTLREAMDELEEYVNNINFVLQVGGIRIVTYSPDSHVLTIYQRLNEAQYELTQQRCLALTDPQSQSQVMRVMRAMDRRTTATVYGDIVTMLRKDGGQRVCLQLQMFPVADEQGNVTAYEGVCRDATEMKHTEKMLLQESEKAQEVEQLKTKFLHNMCYAIRTPLATVVRNAELFEKSHDASEEAEAVETIKKQSAYLLTLVNDILFLSRLDAHMVEINQRECDFTSTLEAFCHNGWAEGRREGVSYVVEHIYKKLVVNIDITNLGRIIEQVLHNAVAHTSAGKVRVRYEYIGEKLIVGIDDTGEGIPKETLEHVFERFNSPSEKGNSTGLGLPICKELAEQMGGKIDITSEVGKGTTVWVSIPCEATEVLRK